MTPEQRAARIHHHTYETCEGIAEHAERIVKLEELVLDTTLTTVDYCKKRGCPESVRGMFDMSDWRRADMDVRMRELGIEVTDK